MRMGLTRRLVLLCGVVVSLSGVTAMAAVNAYMTIEGSTQGAIAGNSSRTAAPAGAIELTSVVQESTAPRDAATGAASGKRQHSAIIITKKIDMASPKLVRAMNTGENLRTVTIVFEGAGGGAGKEKVAQKITLNDAMITSVQNTGTTETIKLTYRQIEVTYVSGGKSATDDWESPK
jgi:type VI secretion system secreted protein Hcp